MRPLIVSTLSLLFFLPLTSWSFSPQHVKTISPSRSSGYFQTNLCLSRENNDDTKSLRQRRPVATRRDALKVTAAKSIASALVSGLVLTLNHHKPAQAERSLSSVTESYRRYVPRMETGFAFLGADVKDMIEDGAYDDIIAEISASKGTKISAMKGTMKIFATAFSDSVVSQITKELQLATFKMSEELENLTNALKEGDKTKALDAYKQAVFFAQVYSELANTAIPRTLDPIRGPQGVNKRFTERDSSIVGAF